MWHYNLKHLGSHVENQLDTAVLWWVDLGWPVEGVRVTLRQPMCLSGWNQLFLTCCHAQYLFHEWTSVGEESLLQAVRSHHLPSSSTYPSPLLQSCSCAYQAFVPSGSLRKTSSSSILSSLMLCSLFFLSSSFPWQHGNSTRMHLRLVRSSCTFLPCCSASRSMGLYLFFLLKVPSQKGMNSSEVCTNLKLHQNCSLTKKTFSPSWRN